MVGPAQQRDRARVTRALPGWLLAATLALAGCTVSSATGNPSAPCFRMNAFWASENFESFIVFRSSQPKGNDAENSNPKRSSFKGSDQSIRQQ